ncbi:MAG TPA: SDR family NAD(P)-dependent oxidoreductase, partial [Tenuifilaceae bacterium]|nr:SDR family NAD(P)-dependent oxidoreductase [Tenuifilaceae bacterium]
MKNKNILVSGSSQGLGYATAEELASRGANVFIGSRNIASIETAAKKIKETAKGKVEWGLLDVTNEESIAKWVNEGAATLGSIDGLVVNAGGPKPGTFEQLSTADWEQGFRLTLMGTVNLINAAIPHFKSNNSGAIVTITSLSVKEPIDILLLSNVFRAGVTSLAKSLSNELAKYNIRVNNI